MQFQSRFENKTQTSTTTFQGTSPKMFSLMAMLALILLGLMPNSLHAKTDLTSCEYSQQFMDGGGFVVIMTGLVDYPIVLDFGTQKTAQKTSQKTDPITISLFASDGSLVHQQNSTSPFMDFTNLSLPTDTYTLNVQVGQATQTTTFIVH